MFQNNAWIIFFYSKWGCVNVTYTGNTRFYLNVLLCMYWMHACMCEVYMDKCGVVFYTLSSLVKTADCHICPAFTWVLQIMPGLILNAHSSIPHRRASSLSCLCNKTCFKWIEVLVAKHNPRLSLATTWWKDHRLPSDPHIYTKVVKYVYYFKGPVSKTPKTNIHYVTWIWSQFSIINEPPKKSYQKNRKLEFII